MKTNIKNKKRMKEKEYISSIMQDKLGGAEVEISSSERDDIDDETTDGKREKNRSQNVLSLSATSKFALAVVSLFILITFIIPIITAFPIYVKPTDSNGNLYISTSFNYTFNFTLNSNCSGVILSN